jgi:hypothetical protein
MRTLLEAGRRMTPTRRSGIPIADQARLGLDVVLPVQEETNRA